jgi:hypothetical protein
MNYKKSYNFGKKQEAIVLPIIREFFADETIRPNEERYAKYDFTSNCLNFELKSRTISANKYPTTMITKDKLSVSSEDKGLILLFSYTDGLYFVEYDFDIFASFESKPFQRNPESGEWKEKEHIYIPIDYLKLIKNY